MKTIGLIGGMSWESTQTYYQLVNEGVKQQLGGLHSARLCLYSVDFAEIEQLQHENRWPETAEILVSAAQSLAAAGADFIVICTNTMHKVVPEMEAAISLPILHIADATAQQLSRDGIRKVGLLGTRFTMEQDFYKQRIVDQYGIEVITPDADQRTTVHQVIYDELCLGTIKESSREKYLKIIDSLHEQGAQAIILGCTEIGLLVKQSDTPVPLYDTTTIHASAAVHEALADNVPT
ncbi:aspartate/glutamate racemase family protein [Vibrio mangrovi]|uniref:Aspartate racemase n=1 Tax=Vibrio mangrovi TaxID=474394 RepID=A0A1Y6IW02_9VIBR|nr:aspartate/glutamate racemase family protein [Vibrio mangrovi]MDW6005069.1 aspartate/glutamate racemase family protein [Vibrio mangrovi]SMS01837.1 Aspartate racemase [Vibrio mangrovi]